MKIVLWAHASSFKPAWRERELVWIQAYAAEWKRLGSNIRFGHPLEEEPPANIVHIFGSGHFETLAWLKPQATKIWFSPFPFSVMDLAVAEPEQALLSKAKHAVKKLLGAKHFDDRSAIHSCDLLLCPNHAKEKIESWKLPNKALFEENSIQLVKRLHETQS